jgi:GMP synthase - Glutamine amidotransferase domain
MISILQHGRDETLGVIGDVINEVGAGYIRHLLWETNEVPAELPSHLVVLGGRMSVNDEEEYPFLRDEKALIRTCIQKGVPVLGICLGAQMIASALGMSVYGGPVEKGWSVVSRVGALKNTYLPDNPFVFQWHGDTFDLPEGATLLYAGDRVRNQMFSYRSALGVQFHPEVTGEIITRWTEKLDPGTRGIIKKASPGYLENSTALCRRVTSAFLSGGKFS